MFGVYRTLSLRYLARRWFRVLLIVVSIALGVATLVATRALNDTMLKAGEKANNPLAGTADLIVSRGEQLIDLDLAVELRTVKDVQSVSPRIFQNVKVPALENRPVLLIGVNVDTKALLKQVLSKQAGLKDADLKELFKDVQGGEDLWDFAVDVSGETFFAMGTGALAAVVGEGLVEGLGPDGRTFTIVPPRRLGQVGADTAKAPTKEQPVYMTRVARVKAKGVASALGGNVLIVDLTTAIHLLGYPKNHVNRFDLTIAPGADRDTVKAAVARVLNHRAEVRTPEEQSQMLQNVTASIQNGFALCGLAALVVGLFLVYNALSVSVAERRHEIGILLSVGATRRQVQLLFAGEATLMGLAGALLGIPLGLLLANVGLEPVKDVVKEIFQELQTDGLEVSNSVLVLAVLAGLLTAIFAALVPAIAASHDKPAEAVRRVPQLHSWGFRILQVASSLTLIVVGTCAILLREHYHSNLGMWGGMVLVLLGTLLALPLLAAGLAWLLRPIFRNIMGIEGRLAADNLVRSPARTGLVIAALASGVALVMQTAGVILSNKVALVDWVRDSIVSDLIVTSGGPVGAGGTMQLMPDALGAELAKVAGVAQVLPMRSTKFPFRDTQILVMALDGRAQHEAERARGKDNGFRKLADAPGGVLVSENFQALHHLGVGDKLVLASEKGPVELPIVGTVVDYSWNHGAIFINRAHYIAHWKDTAVDVYDVYLKPGAELKTVQESLLRKHGAEYALIALSNSDLQKRVEKMIDKLFDIAKAQQYVVMIVAALGVVTALLISVLQRRREMGLLRAIGASQAQVVRSVLAEAALMGVIGTILGVGIGIPMEWYILQVVILQDCGYWFPLLIPWMEVLYIVTAAVLLAMLAGLGPALYSVRQRIPEAIAYE